MYYTFKFEKRQKLNITTTTSKYYKPLKCNNSFDYERITVFLPWFYQKEEYMKEKLVVITIL